MANNVKNSQLSSDLANSLTSFPTRSMEVPPHTQQDRQNKFGSIGSPSHTSHVDFPALSSQSAQSSQPFKPSQEPWGNNVRQNLKGPWRNQGGMNAYTESRADPSQWASSFGRNSTFPRRISPGLSPARSNTQPSARPGLNGHAQPGSSAYQTSVNGTLGKAPSSSRNYSDQDQAASFNSTNGARSHVAFTSGRRDDLESGQMQNGGRAAYLQSDVGQVQSPVEDTRILDRLGRDGLDSNSNIPSNGFGYGDYDSSRAPSRSDSLPASRSSHVDQVFTQPHHPNTFPRELRQQNAFAAALDPSRSLNGRREDRSHHNGTSFLRPDGVRSQSIQSDAPLLSQHLDQLQLNSETTAQNRSHHRLTASLSGMQPPFKPSSYQSVARDANGEYAPSQRAKYETQPDAFDPGVSVGYDTYDSASAQQWNYQSNGRYNAGPANHVARHSPYATASLHPPSVRTPVYDPLNPSRSEISRSSSRQEVSQPPVSQHRSLTHMSPLAQYTQLSLPQQSMLPQNYQDIQMNAYHSPFAQLQFHTSQGLPFLSGFGQHVPPFVPPQPVSKYPGTTRRRSSALEAIHSGRGKKNLKIREVLDDILEICGDQTGSRWVQDELPNLRSEERELLFQAIVNDVMPLSKDMFGNYVIQKFFEHGTQSQKTQIMDIFKGRVWELSTNTYGCRPIQSALDYVLLKEQLALVAEIEPHVEKAIHHTHANHVLQKIIQLIPTQHLGFVMAAVRGQVLALSHSTMGCRTIQKLIEFAQPDDYNAIIIELRPHFADLIDAEMANYVAQMIVEKGHKEDQDAMSHLLLPNLIYYAKRKLASHVVEKLQQSGTQEQKHTIMLAYMNPSVCDLSAMVAHEFGNFPIQNLLASLSAEDRKTYLPFLLSEIKRARALHTIRTQSGWRPKPTSTTALRFIELVENKIKPLTEKMQNTRSAEDTSLGTTSPPPLDDGVSTPQSNSHPTSRTSSTAGQNTARPVSDKTITKQAPITVQGE